jgi:hypothetical protein
MVNNMRQIEEAEAGLPPGLAGPAVALSSPPMEVR